MSNYKIEIDGAKDKASVINGYHVVNWKIDESKSLLQNSRSHVVGLNVKSLYNITNKS